jgi:hypothetical protein
MLEKACQTDPVVRKMWFLANNYNIILSPLNVILHEFLAWTKSVSSSCSAQKTIDSHERYAHHTQSNNHDLLPWMLIVDLALLL